MKRIIVLIAGWVLCSAMGNAFGQEPKPYKEGPVINVSYIKIKPGKFDDYMKFLDTTYKSLMEAQKKAGLILDYAVFTKESRNPQEADLILTTTYANMAALDRTDEFDAVANKVVGTNDTQSKAMISREPMREVLGSELIRQLLLK